MKMKPGIWLPVLLLAACSTPLESPPATSVGSVPAASSDTAVPPLVKTEAPPSVMSTSLTLDGYKQDLAQRISQMNSAQVYSGRPQALLRSVVVLKYHIGENGNLVNSEILRSNRDRETETIALTSLRNTAPFPKPSAHLLRQGRVEILESWLFNNDGRFQLRTVAQLQMTQ